jgi:hypothetical protein
MSKARMVTLERQLQAHEKIIDSLYDSLTRLKAEINAIKDEDITFHSDEELVDCSYCNRAAEASEIETCSDCERNYCIKCQNVSSKLRLITECWDCKKWFCDRHSCEDRSYTCIWVHNCRKA